ncbi:unnamed protein product [Cyprideis torosa]|uniref:Uncharacterized protein n=1 Tax=Cyprideis torosa TaxID=163714 RepID=A0A7R8ZJ45_9CRUS|nr:unnamed protein product [Cyprideis torosa]CAG0881469.1 unnamed protein product [Cyprideis torosa]
MQDSVRSHSSLFSPGAVDVSIFIASQSAMETKGASQSAMEMETDDICFVCKESAECMGAYPIDRLMLPGSSTLVSEKLSEMIYNNPSTLPALLSDAQQQPNQHGGAKSSHGARSRAPGDRHLLKRRLCCTQCLQLVYEFYEAEQEAKNLKAKMHSVAKDFLEAHPMPHFPSEKEVVITVPHRPSTSGTGNKRKTTSTKLAAHGVDSSLLTHPCPMTGCKKYFMDLLILYNHMKDFHHSTKYFPCVFCQEIPTTPAKAMDHVYSYHRDMIPTADEDIRSGKHRLIETVYCCDICNHVSQGFPEFLDHQSSGCRGPFASSKNRPVSHGIGCQFCPLSFSETEELMEHISQKHVLQKASADASENTIAPSLMVPSAKPRKENSGGLGGGKKPIRGRGRPTKIVGEA